MQPAEPNPQPPVRADTEARPRTPEPPTTDNQTQKANQPIPLTRKQKIAARVAAGGCWYCTRPADPNTIKHCCAACGKRLQESHRRNAARKKAERAAQGRSRKPPCNVLCPRCGSPSWRGGKTPDGRQQYKCKNKNCHHRHLGENRINPKLEGTKYRITFHLNPQADDGLTRYCLRNHIYRRGDAIRAILHQTAIEPIPMAMSCTITLSDGTRVTRNYKPQPHKPIPVTHPVRLPNLAPALARERFQRLGEARFRPTVLVVRMVTVWLDGLALAGLLKTTRRHNITHQQAIRLLLSRH